MCSACLSSKNSPFSPRWNGQFFIAEVDIMLWILETVVLHLVRMPWCSIKPSLRMPVQNEQRRFHRSQHLQMWCCCYSSRCCYTFCWNGWQHHALQRGPSIFYSGRLWNWIDELSFCHRRGTVYSVGNMHLPCHAWGWLFLISSMMPTSSSALMPRSLNAGWWIYHADGCFTHIGPAFVHGYFIAAFGKINRQ